MKGMIWGLAIIPLILLGVVVALIVVADGGLTILAGPPVEQVTIQRIKLPEPGIIEVTVVNDGPASVTIPQVLVDEAYWNFSAEPSTTIPRFGSATYTIPYPWVEEETHEVTLITELGATFTEEIAIAVESPQRSGRLFAQFGSRRILRGHRACGIGDVVVSLYAASGRAVDELHPGADHRPAGISGGGNLAGCTGVRGRVTRLLAGRAAGGLHRLVDAGRFAGD